ncbi:MAG: LuxR family transcriptional regulator [Chloroflexi bacterium]|nr:MAG: LuxR family transcriptional regulator [Chloroflexota bacterium]
MTGDQGGKIDVLVLDRQRTFADAVASWLEAETDAAVVVAAYSAQSARCTMASAHVEIMIVDDDLPDGAALTLCAEASGHGHLPRIIMMSVSAEARRIVAAIRAGAVAWVCKDESAKHLLHVIGRVTRGEAWVPPAELENVFQLMLHEQGQVGDNDPLATLTPREQAVLWQVAEGADRKEVAERLHVSVNTVRTHMQSLMRKLGVHSALEAVALTRSRLDTPTPEGQRPQG